MALRESISFLANVEHQQPFTVIGQSIAIDQRIEQFEHL
jgi:hypothetical protein